VVTGYADIYYAFLTSLTQLLYKKTCIRILVCVYTCLVLYYFVHVQIKRSSHIVELLSSASWSLLLSRVFDDIKILNDHV